MLGKSLTAAVFVGLVETVEDTITTLARWNALSIVTPILASRTVYITTALFTSNSETTDIITM